LQDLENSARSQAKKKISTYIFSKLSNEKELMEKTNASVTVTVVRDRKIRTALRTNQIVRYRANTAAKGMRMRQFPHFRFARVVRLFRLTLLFACGV